jgi:hypothetical protein
MLDECRKAAGSDIDCDPLNAVKELRKDYQGALKELEALRGERDLYKIHFVRYINFASLLFQVGKYKSVLRPGDDIALDGMKWMEKEITRLREENESIRVSLASRTIDDMEIAALRWGRNLKP